MSTDFGSQRDLNITQTVTHNKHYFEQVILLRPDLLNCNENNACLIDRICKLNEKNYTKCPSVCI